MKSHLVSSRGIELTTNVYQSTSIHKCTSIQVECLSILEQQNKLLQPTTIFKRTLQISYLQFNRKTLMYCCNNDPWLLLVPREINPSTKSQGATNLDTLSKMNSQYHFIYRGQTLNNEFSILQNRLQTICPLWAHYIVAIFAHSPQQRSVCSNPTVQTNSTTTTMTLIWAIWVYQHK
jgi:hypothetical protein